MKKLALPIAITSLVALALAQSTSSSSSSSKNGSASSQAGSSASSSSSGQRSVGSNASGGSSHAGGALAINGTVYAVTLSGSAYERDQESQVVWRQHNQFWDRLANAGTLILGGELPTVPGEMFLVQGQSEEQVTALVAKDPLVSNKLAEADVRLYKITRTVNAR